MLENRGSAPPAPATPRRRDPWHSSARHGTAWDEAGSVSSPRSAPANRRTWKELARSPDIASRGLVKLGHLVHVRHKVAAHVVRPLPRVDVPAEIRG
jgi:hypothetical protein